MDFMTTASVRSTRSHVVSLPVTAERLLVLLACLAVCVGGWWAFAQLILRVVA